MPEVTYDPAEIRRCADLKMSPTEASLELGVSRSAIMRRAAEHGISLTIGRSPEKPNKTHREIVQDMKAIDAVDYLLAIVEDLDASQDQLRFQAIRKEGFTPTETRILLALLTSDFVSKDRIWTAIINGRPEIPDPRIGDVMICKIRKKFVERACGARIVTHWGDGYSLERDAGFLFPWEA